MEQLQNSLPPLCVPTGKHKQSKYFFLCVCLSCSPFFNKKKATADDEELHFVVDAVHVVNAERDKPFRVVFTFWFDAE